jgi:hypothetical protein
MYRHFGNARDNINHVGNAIRTMPFAAMTSGMGGIAASAGSAAGAIGKAAGSGLRGALSGGAAMLGGPWGIALAGGIALASAFGQAQEESKARVDSFSRTLDQQTGHITNATKSMMATTALDGATSGWDDFFRGVLQGSQSTEEALSNLGISTKEYTDKLSDPKGRDAYVKGMDDISNAMRDGRPITDEMARAIGTTKKELEGVNGNTMRHLADKAGNAADELTKAEEKTRKLAEATGLTDARAAVLAKNFETLSSATSSANDKFSALKANLDILNQGMMSGTETRKQFAQSMADSKKGLEELTKGGEVSLNNLYKVGDGFDFASQSGRDFHTQLGSATDAILKNGTAALDQAIKGGKSSADANSIAIQAMAPGVQALRDNLASLGVESPKIDDIIRSFGLMPDQIATAITVEGTEEAQRKIFLTKLAADSFASGKYDSVLGALPEAAKAAIGEATGTAEAFKNGDYDAVLEALDKTEGGKEAALAAILSVTNGNYTAALRALDLTADPVKTANGSLMTVTDRKISITATDGVSATVWTIQENLKGIKDKSVNITTYYSSASTGEAGSGRQTGSGANGGIVASTSRNIFSGKLPLAKTFANGGIENHVAQISRGQTPFRVWSEPETGGEAYIPLAKSKRERSLKILEEVARIFGFGLYKQTKMFAEGGIEQAVSSTTSSSTTSSGPNVTVQVNPSAALDEEKVGRIAATELYWQLSTP